MSGDFRTDADTQASAVGDCRPSTPTVPTGLLTRPSSEDVRAPPPEKLSLALEEPRFARRLQGQVQNHRGSDLLGVRAGERAISSLGALGQQPLPLHVGACTGFDIILAESTSGEGYETVSYTHLTLPTICSV
eukprot:10822455-Alexandrium_andersonii.AAC.1